MNKNIVITGATKGIGRAIAEKFAAENFDLALCSRNISELESLKSRISKAKSKIVIQQCDVANKGELKNFADKISKELGPVDILVNNAGIFLPGQVITEEDGTLEKLMAVNLYSAYHLSRFLLPEMIKKRSGHIFNLCSVASIQAYPNGGSYGISKFALLGLSKTLREELKEFGIRVTALIPGATYTESWIGADLPESRFMKAEDVANLTWEIYKLSKNTVVEEVLLRPLLGDI